MTGNRRYVLAGVVVAVGTVTGAILLEVLGTILFAITVAYVLVPVHAWLVRRGLSEWWAGIVSALVGFLGAIAVFSPIFVTLYLRRGELIDLLRQLPSDLTIAAFGTSATIEAVDAQAWAIG